MKIDVDWREESLTIETMTVKQLAEIPSVTKAAPSNYSRGSRVRKSVEVEPLNNEYVVVKFLTWKEE